MSLLLLGYTVEEMVFEFAYVTDIFDARERSIFRGGGCAGGCQDLVNSFGMDLDVKIGVSIKVEGVLGHVRRYGRVKEEDDEEEEEGHDGDNGSCDTEGLLRGNVGQFVCEDLCGSREKGS
jgi:hypothetical protein